MARAIVSLSRYLPVPTMRREWNVRPPTTNGVSRMVSTAAVMSAPSYEMHQLDRVARSDRDVPQPGAPHDRAVVLDHHGARVELERAEQLEQRGAARHPALLPVHHDVDRIGHDCHSSSICRAASAGSAASHSARIAATPYAPARRTSPTRAGVTPPMAITGRPSATIAPSRANPSGSRSGCVAVRYSGPTKR